MEAAHDNMDGINARYSPRVIDRIDDAGMRASGKNNQTSSLKVYGDARILLDGIPRLSAFIRKERMGHAFFKFSLTINLTEIQNIPV